MFTENELPEGWYLLGEKESRAMEAELDREVCKEHILYEKKVTAIARREDRDDFLFSAKESEHPLYSVHLTWSKESDPFWPHTTSFVSKLDFIFNSKKIFE